MLKPRLDPADPLEAMVWSAAFAKVGADTAEYLRIRRAMPGATLKQHNKAWAQEARDHADHTVTLYRISVGKKS